VPLAESPAVKDQGVIANFSQRLLERTTGLWRENDIR
jgi:hypothetical protein